MSVQGSEVEGISPTPKLEWTRQVASIMSAWADACKSFRWLHEQAYRDLKRKSKIFNIPVIILQALAGFASVSMQGYVPETYMRWAQLGVGGINFIGGTLTTILNYYRFTQRSEAHFQAWVGWSRLGRLISNELSLERRFRKDPSEFFKLCKAEYERLMEMSPKVPANVEEVFDIRFRGKRRRQARCRICCRTCAGGMCACCCPPEDDEEQGRGPGDSNKSQASHLGIVFPDISDHITHTVPFEEHEDMGTQKTPDFVLHKPPTPLLAEKKEKAQENWQLLRDIINTKKEEEKRKAAEVLAEQTHDERVQASQQQYRARAESRPKITSLPAFRRADLPPVPNPPEVDQAAIKVKDIAKLLEQKFAPPLSKPPAAPPTAVEPAAEPTPPATESVAEAEEEVVVLVPAEEERTEEKQEDGVAVAAAEDDAAPDLLTFETEEQAIINE